MQGRRWARTRSADPQPDAEPPPRCWDWRSMAGKAGGEKAQPLMKLPYPPAQPAVTPRKRNSAGSLNQTQLAIQMISATLHKQSRGKGAGPTTGTPGSPTAGHQGRQFHPKFLTLGNCHAWQCPSQWVQDCAPWCQKGRRWPRATRDRHLAEPPICLSTACTCTSHNVPSSLSLCRARLGCWPSKEPTLDNGSGAPKTGL